MDILQLFRIKVTLFLLNNIQYSEEIKFLRTIQAAGLPYYKILLSLGQCKGNPQNVIFKEQKLWSATKLNRIMDIYYKSNDEGITVSRVEVILIINNTNLLAHSDTGVNKNEFSASIFFSTNVGLMFYDLVIYTCDKYTTKTDSAAVKADPQLLFYVNKLYKQEENTNTDF